MQNHRERARAYGVAETADLFVLAGPPAAPGPRPTGVDIVLLDETTPTALLRENLDVNERGFDPSAAPVTAEQAEAFRPRLRDARAVTLRSRGVPVAAGMVLPVRAGVAELAGIATLAGYRRQGFGRLVTEVLIEVAVERGADLIVLTTDDPAARQLYLSVGFRAARDDQETS